MYYKPTLVNNANRGKFLAIEKYATGFCEISMSGEWSSFHRVFPVVNYYILYRSIKYTILLEPIKILRAL